MKVINKYFKYIINYEYYQTITRLYQFSLHIKQDASHYIKLNLYFY